jgi:two-component system sensor histidine kinase TctE
MAGIDLGYDGPDEALWIEGDRHTLQELLDNLVDNGLRYAGRGASMTIALAREEATICLSVADDGPGVPAQWLPRLGERFFRVPGSGAEGTGLGLAIVQRIAEHHAAQVRYCPGSTRGFLVEVRFPAITKKSGDSGNP